MNKFDVNLLNQILKAIKETIGLPPCYLHEPLIDNEDLESVKASIPLSKWNSQYMQNPTSEEGALIKREWWRLWDSNNPPPCEAIIQSWDTAFLKTERSDYSACTTWGVFYHPDETT